MRFTIAVGLALAALSSPVAAACDNSNAQWVAEADEARFVLYGTKGLNYASKLYLEQWRKDKLAWRGRGSVTCSLGASICYALMRTDGEPNGRYPDTVDIELETIDEDDNGVPEWVVLAAFSQTVYGARRGLQVEWFNGFKPDASPYPLAPNIYKFDGCPDTRTKLDPELGIPLPPVGPIYGIPELCGAYLRDGSLTPDPISGATDGTWWMDDRALVGQNNACDIAGKKDGGNIELICQDSYGVEEQTVRRYREAGQTRYIDDIALTLCKP